MFTAGKLGAADSRDIAGVQSGRVDSVRRKPGNDVHVSRQRWRVRDAVQAQVLHQHEIVAAKRADDSTAGEIHQLAIGIAEVHSARGIERFTHASAGRETISDHVTTVTLATAMRPTLRLYDKTLIVTFNPDRGYFGRASSRAIARALMLVLPASKR